jgi:hypothetical protein
LGYKTFAHSFERKYFYMVQLLKKNSVITIPGTGVGWGGRVKESYGGMNSNMMYLIHCRNFCEGHSVPPTQ